jgi:serine/threonine protein kinase
MMKRIVAPNNTLICLTVEGTAGYCAPESLTKKHYSAKSDVWQAGCCLYAMLSGFLAFDPDKPDDSVSGSYGKMVGIGWDNISEDAKDLIRHILVKNPATRYSTTDILKHPWIAGGVAPDNAEAFGQDYLKRIRLLALTQKMRTLFAETSMIDSVKMKKAGLVAALPFLINQKTSASSPQKSPPPPVTIRSSSGQPLPPLTPLEPLSAIHPDCDEHFFQKLKLLKSGVLQATSHFDEPSEHKIVKRMRTLSMGKEEMNDVISFDRRTSDSNVVMTSRSSWKGIDFGNITYPDFVSILRKVDLNQLATQRVFDLFDEDRTGNDRNKHFALLTICMLCSTMLSYA